MRKNIVLVFVLVMLIAGAVTAYILMFPRGVEGAKTISVTIVADGQTVDTLTLNTDAAYLREALDERNLIQGDESALGFFVKTVLGRTADDNNMEWWCFTKSGEMLVTGIDDTPVEDGDTFEITLMAGWD